MPTTVSTAGVDEASRFDFWTSEITRLMPVTLDSRPAPNTTFHGNALTYDLGALQLSSLSAGPMRVSHGGRAQPIHETEFYKVMLQVSGSVRVEHDGSQSRLQAGDLTICDTARPYTLSYDSAFETAVVIVPRSAISLPGPAFRALAGQPIRATSTTGLAVASLIRVLTTSPSVSDSATTSVVDGATSLITALLMEEMADPASAISSTAMLMRARDHIERHLCNPDLAPDTIASALGISRRYLFKLFAEEEQTVSGYIRARRLALCAQDLADHRRDDPISVIAGRWGLQDSRHLARLFRNHYGCTPSDYRRARRDADPAA